MKKKIIEDLSKLYNIDVELLSKLFKDAGDLIAEEVYEDRIQLKTNTELDFEFAQLNISNVDGQLKVKFQLNPDVLEQLVNVEKGGNTKFKRKLDKVATTQLCEMFKNFE